MATEKADASAVPHTESARFQERAKNAGLGILSIDPASVVDARDRNNDEALVDTAAAISDVLDRLEQ